MADQNIDMNKVVEEVEKQKPLDLDEIFNDLDLVKNNLDESSEAIKQTATYASAPESSLVSKPMIPDDIGYYDTRFDAFKAIIERVSYGTDKINAYVDGHKTALEKYYKDAYENYKDLYVTEAKVNNEISNSGSHSELYAKGYYDGLVYVRKALMRSKELVMADINNKIKAAL